MYLRVYWRNYEIPGELSKHDSESQSPLAFETHIPDNKRMKSLARTPLATDWYHLSWPKTRNLLEMPYINSMPFLYIEHNKVIMTPCHSKYYQWCFATCFSFETKVLKNKVQCSQSNTFSGLIPCTELLCLSKMNLLHISWLQMSHFILVCLLVIWVFSLPLVPKAVGHLGHWKGVMFSCIFLTCSAQLEYVANSFPQCLHG